MYERVIVPLDGSPVAEAILPFVVEIAGSLDTELILLRVLRVIPPEVIEGSRHVVIEDVETRHAESAAHLESLAAALRASGVRVRTEVRRGDAATEILVAARDLRADLVAMTTHGRTGFGRLLFGSVAETVLRRSEVPVFLLRQTETQVAAAVARSTSYTAR